MSIRATAWAWCQKPSTHSAKLVLLALADHADEVGLCWPSLERLAEMTGLSVRAVRVGLRDLEAAAMVVTDQNKGRGNTSRYALAINGSAINPAKPAGISGGKEATDAGFVSGENRQSTTENRQSTTENRQSTTENRQPLPPEPSRTIKNRQEPSKDAAMSLPEWLPQDAWAEWCAHKGRKWGSGIGPKKAINLLSQYRDEGHDPREVIDHSLANGWQGLFPSRSSKPQQAGKLDWVDNHPMFRRSA